MPFLRFDLVEGWSDQDLTLLMDTTHSTVVDVFGVPQRDRYQVVHQHPHLQVHMEDTGLGLTRTARRVFLQITTRPRTLDQKTRFYAVLAERLESRCGISPDDLVISLVENTDADWSFGRGEAQFLTGAL